VKTMLLKQNRIEKIGDDNKVSRGFFYGPFYELRRLFSLAIIVTFFVTSIFQYPVFAAPAVNSDAYNPNNVLPERDGNAGGSSWKSFGMGSLVGAITAVSILAGGEDTAFVAMYGSIAGDVTGGFMYTRYNNLYNEQAFSLGPLKMTWGAVASTVASVVVSVGVGSLQDWLASGAKDAAEDAGKSMADDLAVDSAMAPLDADVPNAITDPLTLSVDSVDSADANCIEGAVDPSMTSKMGTNYSSGLKFDGGLYAGAKLASTPGLAMAIANNMASTTVANTATQSVEKAITQTLSDAIEHAAIRTLYYAVGGAAVGTILGFFGYIHDKIEGKKNASSDIWKGAVAGAGIGFGCGLALSSGELGQQFTGTWSKILFSTMMDTAIGSAVGLGLGTANGQAGKTLAIGAGIGLTYGLISESKDIFNALASDSAGTISTGVAGSVAKKSFGDAMEQAALHAAETTGAGTLAGTVVGLIQYGRGKGADSIWKGAVAGAGLGAAAGVVIMSGPVMGQTDSAWLHVLGSTLTGFWAGTFAGVGLGLAEGDTYSGYKRGLVLGSSIGLAYGLGSVYSDYNTGAGDELINPFMNGSGSFSGALLRSTVYSGVGAASGFGIGYALSGDTKTASRWAAGMGAAGFAGSMIAYLGSRSDDPSHLIRNASSLTFTQRLYATIGSTAVGAALGYAVGGDWDATGRGAAAGGALGGGILAANYLGAQNWTGWEQAGIYSGLGLVLGSGVGAGIGYAITGDDKGLERGAVLGAALGVSAGLAESDILSGGSLDKTYGPGVEDTKLMMLDFEKYVNSYAAQAAITTALGAGIGYAITGNKTGLERGAVAGLAAGAALGIVRFAHDVGTDKTLTAVAEKTIGAGMTDGIRTVGYSLLGGAAGGILGAGIGYVAGDTKKGFQRGLAAGAAAGFIAGLSKGALDSEDAALANAPGSAIKDITFEQYAGNILATTAFNAAGGGVIAGTIAYGVTGKEESFDKWFWRGAALGGAMGFVSSTSGQLKKVLPDTTTRAIVNVPVAALSGAALGSGVGYFVGGKDGVAEGAKYGAIIGGTQGAMSLTAYGIDSAASAMGLSADTQNTIGIFNHAFMVQLPAQLEMSFARQFAGAYVQAYLQHVTGLDPVIAGVFASLAGSEAAAAMQPLAMQLGTGNVFYQTNKGRVISEEQKDVLDSSRSMDSSFKQAGAEGQTVVAEVMPQSKDIDLNNLAATINATANVMDEGGNVINDVDLADLDWKNQDSDGRMALKTTDAEGKEVVKQVQVLNKDGKAAGKIGFVFGQKGDVTLQMSSGGEAQEGLEKLRDAYGAIAKQPERITVSVADLRDMHKGDDGVFALSDGREVRVLTQSRVDAPAMIMVKITTSDGKVSEVPLDSKLLAGKQADAEGAYHMPNGVTVQILDGSTMVTLEVTDATGQHEINMNSKVVEGLSKKPDGTYVLPGGATARVVEELPSVALKPLDSDDAVKKIMAPAAKPSLLTETIKAPELPESVQLRANASTLDLKLNSNVLDLTGAPSDVSVEPPKMAVDNLQDGMRRVRDIYNANVLAATPLFNRVGAVVSDYKGDALQDSSYAGAMGVFSMGPRPIINAAVQGIVLSVLKYKTFYGNRLGKEGQDAAFDNAIKSSIARAAGGFTADMVTAYAPTTFFFGSKPEHMSFVDYTLKSAVSTGAGLGTDIAFAWMNRKMGYDTVNSGLNSLAHAAVATLALGLVDVALRRDQGLVFTDKTVQTDANGKRTGVSYSDAEYQKLYRGTLSSEGYRVTGATLNGDGNPTVTIEQEPQSKDLKKPDANILEDNGFSNGAAPYMALPAPKLQLGNVKINYNNLSYEFFGTTGSEDNNAGNPENMENVNSVIDQALNSPAPVNPENMENVNRVIDQALSNPAAGNPANMENINGAIEQALGNPAPEAQAAPATAMSDLRLKLPGNETGVVSIANGNDHVVVNGVDLGANPLHLGETAEPLHFEKVLGYSSISDTLSTPLTRGSQLNADLAGATTFAVALGEKFVNIVGHAGLGAMPSPYSVYSPGTGFGAQAGILAGQDSFGQRISMVSQGVAPIKVEAMEYSGAISAASAGELTNAVASGLSDHLFLDPQFHSYASFRPDDPNNDQARSMAEFTFNNASAAFEKAKAEKETKEKELAEAKEAFDVSDKATADLNEAAGQSDVTAPAADKANKNSVIAKAEKEFNDAQKKFEQTQDMFTTASEMKDAADRGDLARVNQWSSYLTLAKNKTELNALSKKDDELYSERDQLVQEKNALSRELIGMPSDEATDNVKQESVNKLEAKIAAIDDKLAEHKDIVNTILTSSGIAQQAMPATPKKPFGLVFSGGIVDYTPVGQVSHTVLSKDALKFILADVKSNEQQLLIKGEHSDVLQSVAGVVDELMKNADSNGNVTITSTNVAYNISNTGVALDSQRYGTPKIGQAYLTSMQGKLGLETQNNAFEAGGIKIQDEAQRVRINEAYGKLRADQGKNDEKTIKADQADLLRSIMGVDKDVDIENMENGPINNKAAAAGYVAARNNIDNRDANAPHYALLDHVQGANPESDSEDSDREAKANVRRELTLSQGGGVQLVKSDQMVATGVTTHDRYGRAVEDREMGVQLMDGQWQQVETAKTDYAQTPLGPVTTRHEIAPVDYVSLKTRRFDDAIQKSGQQKIVEIDDDSSDSNKAKKLKVDSVVIYTEKVPASRKDGRLEPAYVKSERVVANYKGEDGQVASKEISEDSNPAPEFIKYAMVEEKGEDGKKHKFMFDPANPADRHEIEQVGKDRYVLKDKTTNDISVIQDYKLEEKQRATDDFKKVSKNVVEGMEAHLVGKNDENDPNKVVGWRILMEPVLVAKKEGGQMVIPVNQGVMPDWSARIPDQSEKVAEGFAKQSGLDPQLNITRVVKDVVPDDVVTLKELSPMDFVERNDIEFRKQHGVLGNVQNPTKVRVGSALLPQSYVDPPLGIENYTHPEVTPAAPSPIALIPGHAPVMVMDSATLAAPSAPVKDATEVLMDQAINAPKSEPKNLTMEEQVNQAINAPATPSRSQLTTQDLSQIVDRGGIDGTLPSASPAGQVASAQAASASAAASQENVPMPPAMPSSAVKPMPSVDILKNAFKNVDNPDHQENVTVIQPINHIRTWGEFKKDMDRYDNGWAASPYVGGPQGQMVYKTTLNGPGLNQHNSDLAPDVYQHAQNVIIDGVRYLAESEVGLHQDKPLREAMKERFSNFDDEKINALTDAAQNIYEGNVKPSLDKKEMAAIEYDIIYGEDHHKNDPKDFGKFIDDIGSKGLDEAVKGRTDKSAESIYYGATMKTGQGEVLQDAFKDGYQRLFGASAASIDEGRNMVNNAPLGRVESFELFDNRRLGERMYMMPVIENRVEYNRNDFNSAKDIASHGVNLATVYNTDKAVNFRGQQLSFRSGSTLAKGLADNNIAVLRDKYTITDVKGENFTIAADESLQDAAKRLGKELDPEADYGVEVDGKWVVAEHGQSFLDAAKAQIKGKTVITRQEFKDDIVAPNADVFVPPEVTNSMGQIRTSSLTSYSYDPEIVRQHQSDNLARYRELRRADGVRYFSQSGVVDTPVGTVYVEMGNPGAFNPAFKQTITENTAVYRPQNQIQYSPAVTSSIYRDQTQYQAPKATMASIAKTGLTKDAPIEETLTVANQITDAYNNAANIAAENRRRAMKDTFDGYIDFNSNDYTGTGPDMKVQPNSK